MNMKNLQKGSASVVIILVLLILLVVVGGLFFITASSLKEARQKDASVNQNTPTQVVQDATPSIVKTSIPSDWKQYTDQNLGFSVRYPSDWTIKTDPLVGITISAPRQNVDGQYGNMIISSSWKLDLGKIEESKFIDPLIKYVEQGSNANISGLKAIKSIKSDNTNVYSTTIYFVANKRYNLITELWTAGGNTDNIKTGMKSDAINILNQITSSLVVK